MKKDKVKSCSVKKQGNKNGKPWVIYEVMFEGGDMGDTFDKLESGHEYEYEVVPNTNPAYAPAIKVNKPAGNGYGGGKTFTRDYGFEKRRTALECAVRMCTVGMITNQQFIETRDKFYQYLDGQ